MKTTIPTGWKTRLLALNAALAMVVTGCVSPKEHSYNDDFGDNLRTKPVYFIQDVDATHYHITVREGTPSNGPERVTDVKSAALAIAKAECQRREWKQWQVDYTEEKNLGWMHVVVTEVTRKREVEPNLPKSDGSP
jgi:hypothetical protein